MATQPGRRLLTEFSGYRAAVSPLSLVVLFTLFPTTLAWCQERGEASKPCERTTLMLAIYQRNLPEIGRLISSGKDLNAKACPEGITALTEAIAEGLPEVARELILAGANANDTSTDGGTPLKVAAFYCQDQTVSLLLKNGAKVNAADNDGGTPLMEAAANCTEGPTVTRLLRAGADVNSRTKRGDTPLNAAVFYGNELAVKQLLAAGADYSVSSPDGTPLEIARNRKIGRKPSHDLIYSFLVRLIDH